jgi:hypothetical protein
MQTISKQMAGKAEGQQRVGNKPLPEVGQVVDHKAHLLTQSAATQSQTALQN